MHSETLSQIEKELSSAQDARERGLEGRARVHARRAAGLALADYDAIHGGSNTRTSNAYELMCQYETHPDTSPAIRTLLRYLTQRVNTEYQLPTSIDLIAVTCELIALLENEVK